MDISQIIQIVNEDYLANCIPLTSLQTEADIAALPFKTGVTMTESEWRRRFPRIDAAKIYLTPAHCGTIFYYDAAEHVLIDVISMLFQEDADKAQDGLLRAIDNIQDAIANEDYLHAVIQLSGATMLHIAGDIIASREPTPKLYDSFLNVYTHVDAGSNDLDIEIVRALADAKSEAQKAKTTQALSALPDVITIYRGMGSASTPLERAYSWSRSQRVACFFATRFCGESYRMVSAKVRKADIIECYDEREEHEIIVLPDAVFDVKVEDYAHLMDFINSDSEPLETAQVYVKAMDASPLLSADIADHDVVHAKRVVVLASYIAANEGICGRYLCKLLTAAQFHDCGRTDSLEDTSHGAKSYAQYAKKHQKDALIEYLMTYHCRDDEDAKKALKGFPEVEREMAWKCLCALKDADALDRVRLYLYDYLDPAFLRFAYSRTLIGAAKELCSKYKL